VFTVKEVAIIGGLMYMNNFLW